MSKKIKPEICKTLKIVIPFFG